MLKPSHNWRKKVEEIEPEQNKRLMEWINVKDKLPEESIKGTPVIANILSSRERIYGNIVISIFYKGKFHRDFNKGIIQQVTHWMEIEPPKQ